jgi:hypothetical protein
MRQVSWRAWSSIPLSAGGEAPVGDHGEECPFERGSAPLLAGAPLDGFPEAEPLPQGVEDVEPAVRPGVLEQAGASRDRRCHT